MALRVTDAREVEILNAFLVNALTLRLYGNDRTPSATDVAANFTEIAGGGYANKPLTFANWTVVGNAPSQALYNSVQSWVFTGPINAPGNIYGYYITRTSDGLLWWAERFPSGTVPFQPIAGSVIRVTPKITLEST